MTCGKANPVLDTRLQTDNKAVVYWDGNRLGMRTEGSLLPGIIIASIIHLGKIDLKLAARWLSSGDLSELYPLSE